MTREIGLGVLPPTTPRHIRRPLVRSLVKELRQRLRDIGEVAKGLLVAHVRAVRMDDL